MSILEMRKVPLDYTKCQYEALNKLEEFIDNNSQIFVLAGQAGVGKTYIIENIINKAQSKHRTVYVLAFTNKAVVVLKNKLQNKTNLVFKKNLRTIHSFLYGSPDEETGEWIPSCSMKKEDFVIFDEASMIDEQIYNDLLKNSHGASFVFIGDPFQLKPINGESPIFKKIDFEMTTVKRQESTSDILKYATALRTLKIPFFPSESRGTVSVISEDEAFDKYTDSLVNGEDSIYLVATNKNRATINNRVRCVLYSDKSSFLNYGEKLISIANSNFKPNCTIFDFTPKYELIKDKVMIKYSDNTAFPNVEYCSVYKSNNDKKEEREYLVILPSYLKASLYHQQVKELEGLSSLFSYSKESKKFVLNKNVTICTYGYAVSTHKFQGSEADDVYVNFDFFWSDPNWLYTAITRAKSNLYLVNRGIAKKEWSEIDSLFNNSVSDK